MPTDLHPDDTAARETIRSSLVDLRRAAGLSAASLAARIGVREVAVRRVEAATTWWMGTVQRHAGALGRRLVCTVAGLPQPAASDTYTAVLEDMAPSDARDRALLVNHLRRVRIRCDVTLAEMGAAMGCRENAVSLWELSGKDPYVISVQRYTRALGGRMLLDLQPIGVEVGSP